MAIPLDSDSGEVLERVEEVRPKGAKLDNEAGYIEGAYFIEVILPFLEPISQCERVNRDGKSELPSTGVLRCGA
jgi:hypothetical protein